MPVHRRGILTTIATGVAGCSSGTDSDTTSTPEALPITVAVGDADSAPDLPVVPAVDVVDPSGSGSHPPRIRVGWTNEGDRELVIGERRAVTFANATSSDDAIRLYASPGPGEDVPTIGDGCWRIREEASFTESAVFQRTDLSPGDTLDQLLGVWGDGDEASGSCIPPGEYRFETTVRVSPDRDMTDDDNTDANWGFTLTIRERE